MTTLESGFEATLREALVDDIEAKLYNEPNNLAFQFMREVADRFRSYGQTFDIDVEPIIEAMRVTDAQRTRNGARVTIEMPHGATGIFEFGASPHTIQGNPVLSFVWEDPPDWVTEEFEQEGEGYRVFLPEVDHPGVPEARAIRDTLHWFRREVQ